jgi:hypothetical protein
MGRRKVIQVSTALTSAQLETLDNAVKYAEEKRCNVFVDRAELAELLRGYKTLVIVSEISQIVSGGLKRALVGKRGKNE